jgi:dihydrofolate reductase
MIKSLIVAMTPKGIIGNNNRLPWPKLPGDLSRFKRLTMGKPCIMGRKTYQSLPKILQGRLNIVVSRSELLPPNTPSNVALTSSVLEAWIKADETGADESFIIGGAEVYHQALPICDRLYLTIVEQEFDGDATLSLPDLKDWNIVSHEHVPCKHPYQNIILEKSKPMSSALLTLERLPKNDLPLPRYATIQSAGLDFSACLTRACKAVEPATGDKKDFWVIPNNSSRAWGRLDHEPHIDPQEHKDLAILLYPLQTVLVPLGFKCSFDASCVLNLYPRSSVGLKGIVLANGTGIVDPDYRGELFAALVNRTEKRIVIKHGERIVQGILTRFSQGIVIEGKVDNTARGEGGLGSTGQMADNITVLKQVVVTGPPPEQEL